MGVPRYTNVYISVHEYTVVYFSVHRWNNQNTIEFPELISHAPAGGFESVVHT